MPTAIVTRIPQETPDPEPKLQPGNFIRDYVHLTRRVRRNGIESYIEPNDFEGVDFVGRRLPNGGIEYYNDRTSVIFGPNGHLCRKAGNSHDCDEIMARVAPSGLWSNIVTEQNEAGEFAAAEERQRLIDQYGLHYEETPYVPKPPDVPWWSVLLVIAGVLLVLALVVALAISL